MLVTKIETGPRKVKQNKTYTQAANLASERLGQTYQRTQRHAQGVQTLSTLLNYNFPLATRGIVRQLEGVREQARASYDANLLKGLDQGIAQFKKEIVNQELTGSVSPRFQSGQLFFPGKPLSNNPMATVARKQQAVQDAKMNRTRRPKSASAARNWAKEPRPGTAAGPWGPEKFLTKDNVISRRAQSADAALARKQGRFRPKFDEFSGEQLPRSMCVQRPPRPNSPTKRGQTTEMIGPLYYRDGNLTISKTRAIFM